MNYISFDEWTGQRKIRSIGTNAGAPDLPFQKWRHFKEAFAPEIIADALEDSKVVVRRCLDPFGGSGTTALACQFSGVHPTTIEVNPFLADLIEAKLTTYNPDALAKNLGAVIEGAMASRRTARSVFRSLPTSFIEPGNGERWLFDKTTADGLARLVTAIENISPQTHRRLFRVILGGLLVEFSNVLVSGKGRRYRKNWEGRPDNSADILPRFSSAAEQIIADIGRFGNRRSSEFTLLRGDSRRLISKVPQQQLCVFSPPYPNSFDYTDIYNIELWMLGYLSDFGENRRLRSRTLSSHVQVAREFARAPDGSKSLVSVMRRLTRCRDDLWSPHLPEMVGGYFADMQKILEGVREKLDDNGAVWIVVGSSRYADVLIPTAKILGELSELNGFTIRRMEHFRSMRTSAQQGGRRGLAETLLVLRPKRR